MSNKITQVQLGTTTYDIEPAVSSTLQVDNAAPTLAWDTPSTVGTVDGVDLTVKMPANPVSYGGTGSATTVSRSDHTHSGYVNQNAFSNVAVAKSGGGTSTVTVAADSATDTVTFEGSNVTITGDATNDKVTIGITKTNVTNALGYTPPTKNTTYTFATGDANGQIKVTPSDGDAQNVSVKGLGSAAYTNSSAYMAAGDTSHGTHVSYGGNGSATTVSRSDHTHSDYVSKTTNTLLNDAISTTWTKYGERKVIITGNDITFDLSAAEGGWACNFASVIDPADVQTTMLGVYGGDTGLTHVYMGGTHSDPALKMTPAGQFTFKNTPKVGSVDVALTSDLPSFTYDEANKTLTIS